MRFLAAFMLSLVFAGSAEAATPFEIFARGDYQAAIEAAAAQDTGESLALAARAALAEADLRDKPCMECLERAQAFAERAIAADPKRAESYIYLGSALGYQARLIGNIRARLGGYPDRIKAAFDAALDLAPNGDWALAAVGGWEIGVVSAGGEILANLIYGAKIEMGDEYFRKAMTAGPDNPIIPFQYALGLSDYDLSGRREQIVSLLKSAQAIAPRTAYEQAVIARAKTLFDLLAANKMRDYRVTVRHYQGYR